jgi:transcription-repair coupling factor (superfamily II helicase)
MRMWLVNPRIMCRQHLLGEHAEVHMFIGTINRKKSVEGYLQKGLLEVHNLFSRHNELVEEMKKRGYKHQSEVEEEWKTAVRAGIIDRKRNLGELINRCSKCKGRYLELQQY